MEENKRRAAEATPFTTQCKDNDSYTKKQQVRRLLLSGNKFTAVEINDIIVSSDARKHISTLRRNGMNIQDEVLEDGHTKESWYQPMEEAA